MTIQHLTRAFRSFLFSALLTSIAGCARSSSPGPLPDGGDGGGDGGGSDANDAGADDSGTMQGVLIDDFQARTPT